MNPEWLKSYQPLSAQMLPFGWFMPTYLTGGDFDRVKALCDQIARNPPANDAERQDVEDAIYHVMIDIVFHANWRARGVLYAIRLPHVREFSHIYESAIFCYYKREYPACVLLLLCALEGILRSFSGLPNPSFRALIDSVRNSAPKNIPAAHTMYRDILVGMLETWIYKKTSAPDADFSLSVLNRHYVMHGLSPGEFYRPQDVHRMILLFDLLIDFIGIDAGVFDGVFLPNPGTNPLFDRHCNYFHTLGEGDHTVKQTWKIERELLKDHPRYAAPRLDEPDVMVSRMITMANMLSIRAKAGKPD